jgi:hypothetical protein
VLPAQVVPTGLLTWMPVIIVPNDVWIQQITVTVKEGYEGSLKNWVEVTTREDIASGAHATVCVNVCKVYLPTLLKNANRLEDEQL